MESLPRELEQLCRECGVLTAYEDVFKKTQHASVDSALAVLGALGVDVPTLDDVPNVLAAQALARLERGVEPVIVQWDGDPTEFEIVVPRRQARGEIRFTIHPEDGGDSIVRRIDLDRASGRAAGNEAFLLFRLQLPRLAWGYHSLLVEAAGKQFTSLIISAPLRAYTGNAAPGGDWGCFLPLYALQSQRNWGAGDFADLQNLVQWTSRLGGDIVGTLPLLAAYLDEPCEPSPYAPASRLAWNEFYTDVTQIPELSHCPRAAEHIQSSDFLAKVEGLRQTTHVQYRQIMALKRQVLEMLADDFFERRPTERYAAYEDFLRRHRHVEDYAAFRATQERRREPWHQWPDGLRDGQLSDDAFDHRSKQYHLYAQWIATSQLETLADAAGGGLYLDLPLGIRPDGYDVWRWRQAYALDVSVGSPPDAMWTKGQDWGFPPLHPRRIRDQGYQHVRDFLRHHLRLSRMLRIDHVMQLHRLYWIPQGLRANQGCYVTYNAEEYYAILNLESHRCEAALVGENLGTVPPAVDQAMERHNMQQMYVVQYEVAACADASGVDTEYAVANQQNGSPAPVSTPSQTGPASQNSFVLNEVTPGSLASLNTHDMPSYASWWRGLDISLRQQLDLIDENDAREARDCLQTIRAELTAWLRTEGWLAADESGDAEILAAILKYLAASDAGVVLVNLEDLWLETEPQNVPGTGPELPNWRRKAAVTLEEFSKRADVLAALQAVSRLRQQAAERQGESAHIETNRRT